MLPVLIIIFFLTVLIYFYQKLKRPHNYPPGPKWSPVLGNGPEVKSLAMKFGGHQHLAFLEMAKEKNTSVLGLKLGREHFVVAFTYPLVREILTKEEFEGRPDNFFIRLRSFGTRKGVTCVDGPFWNEQRSFLMRHMRNLGYGKKLMEIQIKAETDDILSELEKGGPIFEFSSMFSISVINVIWAIATGNRFSRDDKKLNSFISLLQKRAKAFDISGGMLNQYPWLRFILPEKSGYNIINQLNFELVEFFKEVIQDHYENWQEGRNDDLIFAFITQMKAEGQNSNYTEDQLIMICIDLFIAGSTTTASALDFLFLIMLLYPEVQEKIVKEMEANLSPNEVINYSNRTKLPYVEAVILETQRYFSIVPLSGPRRVLKETKLDGYTLPKNTVVLIGVDSVHRDKEYWVDPDVYRPERFLDSDGKLIQGASDRVITFGLGRRRCLGELIARQSIFMFFTSIIRNYKVSVVPGSQPPSDTPLPGITQSPQKYKVHISSRRSVPA